MKSTLNFPIQMINEYRQIEFYTVNYRKLQALYNKQLTPFTSEQISYNPRHCQQFFYCFLILKDLTYMVKSEEKAKVEKVKFIVQKFWLNKFKKDLSRGDIEDWKQLNKYFREQFLKCKDNEDQLRNFILKKFDIEPHQAPDDRLKSTQSLQIGSRRFRLRSLNLNTITEFLKKNIPLSEYVFTYKRKGNKQSRYFSVYNFDHLTSEELQEMYMNYEKSRSSYQNDPGYYKNLPTLLYSKMRQCILELPNLTKEEKDKINEKSEMKKNRKNELKIEKEKGEEKQKRNKNKSSKKKNVKKEHDKKEQKMNESGKTKRIKKVTSNNKNQSPQWRIQQTRQLFNLVMLYRRKAERTTFSHLQDKITELLKQKYLKCPIYKAILKKRAIVLTQMGKLNENPDEETLRCFRKAMVGKFFDKTKKQLQQMLTDKYGIQFENSQQQVSSNHESWILEISEEHMVESERHQVNVSDEFQKNEINNLDNISIYLNLNNNMDGDDQSSNTN